MSDNKAKPEVLLLRVNLPEEALTFCSRYLKDDVETRFNRPGRNDDGLPEQTDKFQVFRSVCKPTGRMKETRLTTDVMQAVVWFVLNNSPEDSTLTSWLTRKNRLITWKRVFPRGLITRKLPGGGSTSRRRANRAYEDVMTRDQMTQILRQQEQEKELLR
ncbi:hypothetical protein Tco_1164773 [Tanacetum coccineum]